MPPNTTLNVDLTRIENAEVRRAIRQLIQQLQETISQQQVEIEALLELMLDKNLTSLGEFRLHMQRIAQRVSERNERLHNQVTQAVKEQHTTLQAAPREDYDHDEHEGRRVYRL